MAYEVRGREVVFEGKVITVRRDLVAMSDGNVVAREVVAHPGAVGIVAMDRESGCSCSASTAIRWAGYEWELPAGILDVLGEQSLRGGGPRVQEEAHVTAAPLGRAGRLHTSPGMTDEAGRVFWPGTC